MAIAQSDLVQHRQVQGTLASRNRAVCCRSRLRASHSCESGESTVEGRVAICRLNCFEAGAVNGEGDRRGWSRCVPAHQAESRRQAAIAQRYRLSHAGLAGDSDLRIAAMMEACKPGGVSGAGGPPRRALSSAEILARNASFSAGWM